MLHQRLLSLPLHLEGRGRLKSTSWFGIPTEWDKLPMMELLYNIGIDLGVGIELGLIAAIINAMMNSIASYATRCFGDR